MILLHDDDGVFADPALFHPLRVHRACPRTSTRHLRLGRQHRCPTRLSRSLLVQAQWRLEQVSADHVRLTGQVEIESDSGTKFFADEIDIFSEPTLHLVASGNVVFTNAEGRIAAERAEFDVGTGTGIVLSGVRHPVAWRQRQTRL